MQKKLSIILVVIIFGAILIFANSKGFLTGAKDGAQIVASPIGAVFSKSGEGVNGFFSGLFNLGKLQRENATLGEDVNRLKSELTILREIESENKSLRLELGFIKKNGFNYATAEVVGYDPSNLRGMVTVNKGEKDGIKVGMAVTSEGYLVGRISGVTERSSRVQLVTDPTSAIPVSIQGTKINGIAKGELGSGLSMEKIPQGDKFEVGDVVITSGLGGEIPRGIIIGEVESIEAQENSLFVSAKINVYSDINNVLRVLIIKGS